MVPWHRAWFMKTWPQPCLPSALKGEGADDQAHCTTAGRPGPLGTTGDLGLSSSLVLLEAGSQQESG